MKIIEVTNASYNPMYNPETCNNGGGYWQYRGNATVTLDCGATAEVELDDTSCGDFGERCYVEVTVGIYMYNSDVDCVDGSDNFWRSGVNDIFKSIFRRDYGESLDELVAAVRKAICDAAWEKYCRDCAQEEAI